MSPTAAQLWQEMWPEVAWVDASPEDKRMFLMHALSVSEFNERRNNNG